MFWKIVGALLVIWLAVTVLGFVVKSLFWLAAIGGLMFLGTAAYGAIKSKGDNKRLNS